MKIPKLKPRLQVPITCEPLPDKKPDDLFASALNRSSVNPHRSRVYSKVRYNIHVSDLMQSSSDREFCAREHAINFHENRVLEMVRASSPGMELLWAFGHAAQDHITSKFRRTSMYGATLWGDWTCGCGETLAIGCLQPHGMRCNHCGGAVAQYKEYDLRDDTYNVVGHPDILILWNGVLHIYEVKTIDRVAVDFDKLSAPLGDHKLQGTFYYWIMDDMHKAGKLPYPVSPTVNYLYIDRSSNKLFFGKPYKEFQAPASPRTRIDNKFAAAKLLQDSLAGNRLPPKLCDAPTCSRAKTCGVVVSCFSRRKDTLDDNNSRSRA